MKFSFVTLISILSTNVLASPISIKLSLKSSNSSSESLELVTGTTDDYLNTWYDITYPSIENCNATQTKMINKYYQDLLEVASTVRDHLINEGVDDTFIHWFGENGNPVAVLGFIDNIVQGNKDGVLYRCDDIDGTCAKNPTYPGYHRSIAEQETVICDLFFTSKRPIEDMCVIGNITTVKPKKFAGIDLFHRFCHLESINKGFIAEYVEDYDQVVDYAENNSSYAVLNVDNMLYYLAETYSLQLTDGGCLGNY
ncbi:hypothetical protein C6P40_001548 [Pichia californica]|uniref:Putative peptidase domain-containing protein n=1 Tax=Pichia californica TaxID=460514 RepID=A0A9P6WIV8_9ASCO|nr:hypothetical protein C6P42_001503 [[Candida] californica]KAG0687984.1 hypothetical protein C6P40_001548 [[Candida] californica]